MFGIVSRCSRERNFYAAGMEEVSMRSFASAIDEPMLFQIGDELPNLTGHTDNITEVKTSKQRRVSVGRIWLAPKAVFQRSLGNPESFRG